MIVLFFYLDEGRGCTYACTYICIGKNSQPFLENRMMDVYETFHTLSRFSNYTIYTEILGISLSL